MQKFFAHLSWILLLNLLIKPAYLLVIDAKIQDALGPEIWGSYFPLLSLSILLNIFLDAGLTNHMTRTVSQQPSEINGVHRAGWRTKLTLIPLYLAVLMAMGYGLGYRGQALVWLFWIGGNQALLSAVLYVRTALQGSGDHVADAWVSVSDRVLLLIGMGWLLWTRDSFELHWLLAGTTAALSLAFLAGWFRVEHLRHAHRSAEMDSSVQSSESAPGIFAHLKASWPYALLVLLMMTYHRVDAIMLERLAPNGAMQAGWYAMGYRIFEAANMIGYLFATLLLPYFTRMLSQGEDIRPLAVAVSQLLWVGAASVAWTAAIYPTAFLDVFYADHLEAASSAFPWLMVSFAIFAQGYVFSTLLTARGDLKHLNQLAGIGALINIALNAWWLSRADAANAGWGCAAISALSQLIVVGLQTTSALRAHPGQLWRKIGRTAALHTLFAGAICIGFWRWADASIGSVACCLGACLAVGALPGITNYSSMRALLSDKMNTFADS